MLDHIESYLSVWTGRAEWPVTTATLESRLIEPINGEHDNASKFVLFAYEVNTTVYLAAVREVAGNQNRPSEVGDVVSIQYDPKKPERFYYSPSCPLASKFVVVLSIATALLIIVNIVLTHRFS